MKKASLALVALFGAASCTVAPAGIPVVSAQAEAPINWSYERYPDPVRFRAGEVTLTVRGLPDKDMPDFVTPLVAVEAPGLGAARIEGVMSRATFDHQLSVGRLDEQGDPLILLQSFSGGAHCCNEMTAVVAVDGQLQAVPLGEWNGGYLEDFPEDIDGDGLVDIVQRDNAFLYAFASYADSYAPAVVLNIVGGKVEDVSARPGFRSLFRKDMEVARSGCIEPGDYFPNGACAAYVAAAARIGEFDRAWSEMLTAYDPAAGWTLPTTCAQKTEDGSCPDGQEVEYQNYPDALRAFLQEQGYL